MALQPNYLVIGHITKDLYDGGYKLGGTATFSALTARNLGYRAGIVSSNGPDVDLSRLPKDVLIESRPSEASTTFQNIYEGDYRSQYVRGVAAPLAPEDVPSGLRNAPVVLLGPLVREMSVDMARLFPNSLLGVTAQGWMRQWDGDGLVHAREWREAEQVLPLVDVLVFSYEDVDYDLERVKEYASLAKMAVVTHNRLGAVVYCDAGSRWIPAFRAVSVDPTGAGDVFAASYLVALGELGDPYEAARFANCAAALSIEGDSTSTIPTRAQVEERLLRDERIDDVSVQDYNMIQGVLL